MKTKAQGLKNHQIAELVNVVTKTCHDNYHLPQMTREVVSREIISYLKSNELMVDHNENSKELAGSGLTAVQVEELADEVITILTRRFNIPDSFLNRLIEVITRSMSEKQLLLFA